MSRTSLHTPRRPRVVWDRPATGTRLFTCPFPPTIPHLNTHYKRCPRAERLRPGSDQPLSRPVHVTDYGRFPDNNRHALSKGPCQVRAALNRRTTLALSGDAHEHGVILLNRAIVPRDSTVVAFGEAMPHGDGTESTPPYLRMAGHFWWSRLPHTEIPSRLLHILSEARGCRKAGANVEHPLSRTSPIGTGVAVFLRNRPGPSIPSPVIPARLLRHSCGGRNPSPEAGPGRSLPRRGDRLVALGWGSPLVHFPSRDDRPVAQGVHTPPPTQERNHPLAHTHTPFPHN